MPVLATPVVPPGAMSARPQPTLSGHGIVLRPVTPADAPTLVAAYAQPSIQQWHVTSLTDGEAVAWIAERPRLWRAETRADWAVTVGSVMVGRIGLKAIDLEGGRAEVAYWILTEHRRRGHASGAVSVVTDWGFHDLGLHRIELSHATGNPSSCRVADRAGYRLEGIKRQSGHHADGWHDMHLHARIVTD